MAENIYDDVAYPDEPQSREQTDMDVNIVVNADAVRCHYGNTETENGITTRKLQNQHTGSNLPAKKNYCRLIAVCVLLCVVLLIVIAVLCSKFNTLTTERDQLQKQKDVLQTKVTNLGWIFLSSKPYYISTEKKNWTESRQDCIKRGLDLVIINSAEEQEFVKNLSNAKNYGIYIGLTDRDIEGVWKWVDGKSMTTAYWSSGNGFTDNEDCVVNGYNGNDGWNDRPCEDTFYWICE